MRKGSVKLYDFRSDAVVAQRSSRRFRLVQNLEQLQALLQHHDLQIRYYSRGKEYRYIVYSYTVQRYTRDWRKDTRICYGFANVGVGSDGTYRIDDYFSQVDWDDDLLELLDRTPLALELFEPVPKRRHKIGQKDLLVVANALSGKSFEHMDVHRDEFITVTTGRSLGSDLLHFLQEKLAGEYDIASEEEGTIAIRKPYVD